MYNCRIEILQKGVQSEWLFLRKCVQRFTTVDPHAENYYSHSPYVYVKNNPLKYIDPDGRDGWPALSPADYQRMAASKEVDRIIKDNSSTIQKNGVLSVVSMTDVNDAVVLGTTITRGSNAINVDGTSAGGIGIGFAMAGAILPAISGSAVKSALKNLGKALGIISDTKKVAKGSEASSNFQKLLTPIDEFDATTTIYRGTTGSEATSSVLFATDNAEVAATYVKNGGQVVQYNVSQFGLKSLEKAGQLRHNTGIHNTTGDVSKEYMFQGSDLVKYLNSIAQPVK